MSGALRVAHVINLTGWAGAEGVLYSLLAHADRSRFEHSVISLAGPNDALQRFGDLGVATLALGIARPQELPAALVGLAAHWRLHRPDVVQTWMYHSDLAGGLAARLAGSPPVVWNVRRSRPPGRGATALVARACGLASWLLPARIICCAHTAIEPHVRLGYDPRHMTVIGNGVDVARFRPDAQAGSAMRAAMGIPAGQPLVGMAARWHPDKDHRSLIAAARQVAQAVPDAHFALCGAGIEPGNAELAALLAANGVTDRFHLCGLVAQSERFYAMLDVACLCSRQEGFPNVVSEAMACGVPCVVTEAGDAVRIVGDTGSVVPIGDVGALSAALIEWLQMSRSERQEQGELVRQRIIRHFGIAALLGRYEQVWHGVAQKARA